MTAVLREYQLILFIIDNPILNSALLVSKKIQNH